MKLEGFVIVTPLSPWDEKLKDKIIPDMAYGNFGKTEAEAWRRFMGHENDPTEFSRKVQFYFDRGYRVKKATLDIDYE